MTPDRWIDIPEAARLANVPERTFRRRLWFLHHQSGGQLLKRVSVRRLQVSADALQRHLRTDPGLHEAELAQLRRQLADHEQKLTALRDSMRAQKKRLKRVEEQLQLPLIT